MAAQKGLDFLLKGADSNSAATISSVNTSTDVITTGTHGWSTGQAVQFFTTGVLPAPLAVETIYYINVATATTFTAHTTLAAANAGTGAVNLTDSGSGTNTVQAITTLAGMRTTTMTIANEVVDVTTKDSGGSQTLLAAAGVQSMTMDVAGIFADSNIEEDFRGFAFAQTINVFHLFFGNGDTLTAAFQISNYGRAGEYNNAETYSMTLNASGSLTYTAV